jgi:hypothetical protein
MKKNLIVLVLMSLMANMYCQNIDQENLEKYWKYRDQLRKRFMKIGTAKGESIPASVIIPNRQYGQIDQSTGSIVQWRDATITMGYYWIVLAIEYKLLSENYHDVQPTLNELYSAMQAFNRLDMTAEDYLDGNLGAAANPSDKNGFFIRDDVPHEMADNFAGDPPIPNGPIQPDPGNPNQMRSGFEGWTNYDNAAMGDEAQTTEPQLGNSESLDQLTTVILGLHFIQRFIPDGTWVQPTASDSGMYIREEALEIIKRLVEYLNDTEANWLGQYSAREWTILQNENETAHNGGTAHVLASNSA